MDKQSTEHNEETLVAMLASFRKEACYHDNFEEDFLRNFHLRKETDPATHTLGTRTPLPFRYGPRKSSRA